MNSTPWPLVGRAGQIAEVSALLGEEARGVLLTGEPGIGKSRLAAEVLDRCAHDGAYVVRTSGAQASSRMPFHAMTGLLAPPHAHTNTTALPDSGPRPGGEPTADLFACVARELQQRAGGRPVVLGVDEADHLDAVSGALVQHLAATARATPLLAARTDALDTPTVRALRGRSLVREFVVGGLDREQVGELLHGALGGPVDGLTTDRLHRLTGGNPLFLQHLVATGRSSGALRASAGVWRWYGPLRGYERLTDLVAGAVRSLGPEEARALEWIAHTEPVPLTVLERLAVPDSLEELERRLLITLEGDGDRLRVRTSHPLYGEITRSRTPDARRRIVYREFADALAGSSLAQEQRLALVNWRLLAGDPVADQDILAAASDALARRDPCLAERLARTVPAGRGLLAEALVVQARAEEAEQLLAQVDRPALRALNLFWGLRRITEATEVLQQAKASRTERPTRDGRARPAGDGTEPQGFDGTEDAGRDRTEPNGRDGTESAGQDGDRSALARAELAVAELALATFGHGHTNTDNLPDLPDLPPGTAVAGAAAPLRAYLLTFGGRPGAVVAQADSGELPLTSLWPTMGGAVQASHLHALVLAGRINTALATAQEYYQAAVEQGVGDVAALLTLEWGVCHTWAGNHTAALPHYREARALIDEHTPFPVQAFVFSEYAAGLGAAGDAASGQRVLSEGENRLPTGSAMREHLALGRIRLLACSGRPELAAPEAEELGRRYLARGRLTNAVEALYYASRIRPSVRTAALLEELAALCDSPLFPLLARHARASADHDHAALGEVSAALSGLGYHGMAAEASARAAAYSGGREAAHHAYREARQRELCQGFRAPWSPRTALALPLTPRQREVCELAARGLDNPTIATRLALSVRTVANHLQAAYTKLGVRSRSDLASALGL
ncbi:AAA family ATPase [Streptomyces sp. NPDC048639]|uniref:helix-turn-helix transcriptional regulator n=1 Tax=Streptomyces sp. NPDC048639 TaxID=3365581 RepID=UPI0037121558